MRDRFCWVVVTLQVMVLCIMAYIIGVHAEKIGWLEDLELKRIQQGEKSWEKVDVRAVVKDVNGN